MEMISLCGSCYKPNKTHLSTVITPRIPFFYLYYWVDISAGGPLFPEGIIRPVVSASITQSIHLLVDYYSPRVSSAQ